MRSAMARARSSIAGSHGNRASLSGRSTGLMGAPQLD